MNNLYNLHYKLDEIEPNLQKVIAFIEKPVDNSEPTKLLTIREEARMLLIIASRCHLTADYYYRKLSKRSGEEYALYASLREYTEKIKKDLETTLISISSTISYYKNER